MKEIRALGCATNMHIAHLIYYPTGSDLASKDYEFSRGTMEARWHDGYDTTRTALTAEPWVKRKPAQDGVAIYNLSDLAAQVHTAASR